MRYSRIGLFPGLGRSTSPLTLVAIPTGNIIFDTIGFLWHLGPRDANDSTECLLVLQRLRMLLHGVQSLLGVLEMGLEEASDAITKPFVGEVGPVKGISIVLRSLTNGPHKIIVKSLCMFSICRNGEKLTPSKTRRNTKHMHA